MQPRSTPAMVVHFPAKGIIAAAIDKQTIIEAWSDWVFLLFDGYLC